MAEKVFIKQLLPFENAYAAKSPASNAAKKKYILNNIS
jgi:hypothetical protein